MSSEVVIESSDEKGLSREPAKGADVPEPILVFALHGLSFDALRQANMARLPQFKNKHGEPAHSQPDGSDWSDAQWLQAVVGELGEYANLKKKVDRGDISREEAQPMLADELADVATYLDILAFRLGVDLGAAVADKFNRISIRVGSTVRLAVSAPRAARSDDGAFVWFSDYTMLDRASPIKAEVTTMEADTVIAELVEYNEFLVSAEAKATTENYRLKHENASLRAKLDERDADAERYRWLRDHPTMHYGASLLISVAPGNFAGDITGDAAQIDEYLDAAMADSRQSAQAASKPSNPET